uniref:Uncharacterized protein CW-orf307 n=1 Tax=Oryza rufipogon TaxID=4529 RepID=D3DEZ5_ORYRU|nr:hypothetical protein OrrupM_p27 [Oryza rufipogon]BAI67968.1 hypothetical protein [Oryza rufipogon]
MFIMIRFERACSRFIGKWLFSQDSLSPDLLFLILLILVFVSRMLVRALWPRSAVLTSRIFTTFVVLSSAVLSGSVAHAADNEPINNGAAPAAYGSGAEGPSNSALFTYTSDLAEDSVSSGRSRSTASSSFFQGLSGQIPTAPNSPGEEVQQNLPNFLSLPEEDTVEHLLGAGRAAGGAGGAGGAAGTAPAAEQIQGEDHAGFVPDLHQIQHDVIRNRLATSTPTSEVSDDEIDARIFLKKDIIDRMAQLDPDRDGFWNEQKDHLVAHGILNKGKEYTFQGLINLCKNLNKCDANSPLFNKIKKINKY